MVSGGTNCLIYVGVACAAWQLQRRAVTLEKAPFVMPGGTWLIPAISVAAMLMVLSTLKRNEWISILLALGLLVAIHWVRMGLARLRSE